LIELFNEIEERLPAFLDALDGWSSVYVDYHPPIVRRLWRQWDDTHRIFLHEIEPCGPGEALYHPHPWPSAVKILSGRYQMGIGYGSGTKPPPIGTTALLTAGSSYEMIDRDAWHYVRPLVSSSMSLMITGKPWEREAPKSHPELRPLTPDEAQNLLAFFEQYYKPKPISW
jgi:hypothetical protein